MLDLPGLSMSLITADLQSDALTDRVTYAGSTQYRYVPRLRYSAKRPSHILRQPLNSAILSAVGVTLIALMHP